MKKLLVSLSIITILASCGENTTSTTDLKKDSLGTSVSVDSTKMGNHSTDTSMHKMDTTMSKMDTTMHK